MFRSLLTLATLVAASATNVVFIAVDDLRPELGGPYGASGMITPALDSMMAEGTTFTRAYAQVSVCSPSRTSFLTGMRPRHNRVWTIGPYFRQQAHNSSAIVTLSQALKAAGWNATGAGKVWHPGTSSGGSLVPDVGGDDMPWSWSYGPDATPYNGFFECDQFYNGTVQSPASVNWPGGAGCVQSPACQACLAAHGVNGSFDSSWVSLPCDDSCLPDGLVADRGVQELQWKAANPAAGPWALFLGMKRPHLNFFAPTWAYSLYDNASTPIAQNRFPPPGMPDTAFFQNGEISGGHDMKGLMYTYTDPTTGNKFDLVTDWKQHELKWAYRSAVTYMDRQVGRVLSSLEALGLRNDTWVLLFGDHGWSLGERGEWAKQNLFEEGTRVPLIIVPPTGPAGAGFARNATFGGLVELVDLYPTLAEVLQVPSNIIPPGQLEGQSLVPALQAATHAAPDAVAAVASSANFSTAFCEICRGTNVNETSSPPDGSIHGLSIRTPQYRFNAWLPFNYTLGVPLWSQWNSSLAEFYDYSNFTASSENYDAMELVNVVNEPAYASQVAALTAMAQAQWPEAPSTWLQAA